jgi:hypothetical protein
MSRPTRLQARLGYALAVAIGLAFSVLWMNWAACDQDDAVCLISGADAK